MLPLADDYITVIRSPDPQRVYCYSPGICTVGASRLIVTCDLGGPGVADLSGPKGTRYGKAVQGKVFVSDDHGARWRHVVDFPFMMARPFTAGGRLYVLGLAGDLAVIASDDAGETWSPPASLTDGMQWSQAPANVWYANDCVYLVMNRRPVDDVEGWKVSVEAPVLMRAPARHDLTRRESWTFAQTSMFRDLVAAQDLDWFGVPFFTTPEKRPAVVAPGRSCSPIGWLETNVVQMVDPRHYWHDPSGRTFHLFSRAHTGGTGFAALAKVVEEGDAAGTGPMRFEFERVPSGARALFLPMPGGQMKFHLLYDQPTELYWLLSTQATDSMVRAQALPPDRYNLPNNERRRLQLHFSRNMVDWCFAGLVAAGPGDGASRHYAAMIIDGDDLQVLSRSGDVEAKNAHDTNMITLHTIRRFRDLVY